MLDRKEELRCQTQPCSVSVCSVPTEWLNPQIQERQKQKTNRPELVVGPPPHLQVLRLFSVPECPSIGLIPDVNDQAPGHTVTFDIRKQAGQIIIPACPIPIITWVWGRRILRSISSPQIVNQKYKVCTMLSRSLVIRKSGGEPILQLFGSARSGSQSAPGVIDN